MERSAIFHRPGNNDSYIFDDSTLAIRIKTKKDNVDSIQLLYGDPYMWKDGKWIFQKMNMLLNATDALFDYWEVKITPPHRRIRYGFELHSHEEILFYTEKGFYEEAIDDCSYYFCFPYLHASELFDAPAWVKDTYWYQIFPERFANGSPTKNTDNVIPWGSAEPTQSNFFGGDIEGIIQHLDYLVDLGINGIYLTPIFTAQSNHKYDTIDYFEIDPQFGTKEDFKRLVKECHARGIKVMLDAVFNHCGYYFPPFQDVLEKGNQSDYLNWFYPHNLPLHGGQHPNYETFGFVESMPKLNTQHPEVEKYLLDVASYWIKEFDIDGWRLDVANEVDHQFWRKFRAVVRKQKPDLYILGEIWHDSMPWLLGDQFDAVMNYPFTTNVLNLLAKQTISAQEFMNSMTTVIQSYPKNVMDVTFNLVGSHDTPRILTECQEDLNRVKLIYTLLYTFIGSPCMYYGDEIGMTGGSDPGCRKCMEWNQDNQDLDLLDHVKKLISLRQTEKLLANEGDFQFLNHIQTEIVAYRKYQGDRNVLVIINPTNNEQIFKIPYSLKGLVINNMWSEEQFISNVETNQVKLEPFGFRILAYRLGTAVETI
ncbi:alpha-glycosidase [Paenisporosarcina sp. TG20]|uniref:alpha-glycosidase n=1 Tax=Paenisporosarcina sp. TG20 TaxID=1211706 RepID=UPI0002E027AD|nr:alpha-glycosidase [Paenisporosarcina sp. TG20]